MDPGAVQIDGVAADSYAVGHLIWQRDDWIPAKAECVRLVGLFVYGQVGGLSQTARGQGAKLNAGCVIAVQLIGMVVDLSCDGY
ncbi:hypothetical protein BpHYR1_012531 [Brachionus plicatilis]|uniref:Uncharacterized protein n=1 Tax=Brachionus plicatilis TaxID=10195 RepID=A0A3M7SCB5_BRAPC|nr:hypothetical protein BpHYR1_012531 [Brachionus plicatilis]